MNTKREIRRRQSPAQLAPQKPLKTNRDPKRDDPGLSDVIEIHRPPDTLPNPWLFNSEALLRELDRCRELVLQIPVASHATHFGVNIAIDALWNLRENLRYILLLHRQGQDAFAKQATDLRSVNTTPAAQAAKTRQRAEIKASAIARIRA